MSLTGLARPEEVPTLFVTDAILPMLGAQPMLGRLISKTDDAPGGPETVMLSAGYWRAKFGGDQSAVGRTLMLDSRRTKSSACSPTRFASSTGRSLSPSRSASTAARYSWDSSAIAAWRA